MGYGWGGYANGQIPYGAMVLCRGGWFEPTAAYWAEAMALVFEAERGKPLSYLDYTEGFRPLGEPGDYAAGRSNTQYFYAERKRANPGAPAAASPGNSIHGWALAADVNLTGLNEGDIEWLHTRGRAFGWNWETTGRPNDEPWHLDFNLEPTEPFDPAHYSGITAAPAPEIEEDSNMITIKNTNDGALFSLDNQQLTYHGQTNEAILTAAVNSVKDEIHELSKEETAVVFSAYGIPRKYMRPGVMQDEGFGNNWSRQLEILEGQKEIAKQLAKLLPKV